VSQSFRVQRIIELERGGSMGNQAAPVFTVKAKNKSGGALARGDIVIFDTTNSTADLMCVTTTTNANSALACGMVYDASIASNGLGRIQIWGPTNALKVDGTDNIAVGDLIGTFTTAKIGAKTAGPGALARAMEGYITDDSAGVIDAWIGAFLFIIPVGMTAHTHANAGEGGTLAAAVVADVTASAAELNLLDTSVAGTSVASKALVLGATKNTDILGLPVSGLKIGVAGAEVVVTPTAAEINILAGVVAGTATASKAAVLGATKNLDILGLPVSGLKIGAAGAEVVVTPTAAEINVLAGVSGGVATASKVAVLGATKNLDILGLPVGGLKVGAAGAEVVVTPSAAELNLLTGVLATTDEINKGTDQTAKGADGLLPMGIARFTFNPSATAGMRTVAAHGLGVTLPAHAIVMGGFFDVNTAFTSENANNGTVAIHVEGANDIQTATAVSGEPYVAIGRKAIVPKANTPESTAVKTSVAREITATVDVSALTAGKLTGFLYYVVSVASA
jgi:hypothetical protein